MYDGSLKRKWDNKNVLDYAISTAEAKGLAIDFITRTTKLSIKEIENL